MTTYVYVCEDCGKEFEAERRRDGHGGRPRKCCDACRAERGRERKRAHDRKRSPHAWAQRMAEDRRAESALHRCGGAKDPASFAWPSVYNGQAVASEIRGQMSFAPAQLLGRLK